MIYLYLVRHGETEWNVKDKIQGRCDSPLTDRGIMQATFLAKRLADITFESIYCSPAGRALATTRIIAEMNCANLSNGLVYPAIQIDDRLSEMDFGKLEGQVFSELQKTKPELCSHFKRFPQKFIPSGSGETFGQVVERARLFLEMITCSLKSPQMDKNSRPFSSRMNILVVSHAMLLQAILMLLENRTLETLRDKRILQASLTAAVYDPDRDHWHIELFADTSHYFEN